MVVSISAHQTAASLYFNAGGLVRLLQRGRPYICPIEPLVEQVPRGARVLDLGCGSGLFALHLVNLGRVRSVHGVDLSPQAVAAADRARKNLPPALQDRARFEVIEDFALWPRETFDAVSMIDMMHHVPVSIRKALFSAALDRVAPGGVLVYKDMRRRPRWRAAMNQLHDLVLARQWINHCPSETIIEWAKEAGATVRHHSVYDRAWYAHELITFSR